MRLSEAWVAPHYSKLFFPSSTAAATKEINSASNSVFFPSSTTAAVQEIGLLHIMPSFFPSSTTAAVQEKSIQQVTLFPFFCNGISITVSSDFLTHPILDYNSSSLLLQQLLLKKSIQQQLLFKKSMAFPFFSNGCWVENSVSEALLPWLINRKSIKQATFLPFFRTWPVRTPRPVDRYDASYFAALAAARSFSCRLTNRKLEVMIFSCSLIFALILSNCVSCELQHMAEPYRCAVCACQHVKVHFPVQVSSIIDGDTSFNLSTCIKPLSFSEGSVITSFHLWWKLGASRCRVSSIIDGDTSFNLSTCIKPLSFSEGSVITSFHLWWKLGASRCRVHVHVQNKYFIVQCTIKAVKNGWCYTGCKVCPLRVEEDVDEYHCSNCKVDRKESAARFRVQLQVVDSTDETADFVILDTIGEAFFSIEANTLFHSSGANKSIPP
ncbi:hypothetical protein LINPERPRIM_LOCUS26325 [Linum perenne]